MAFKLPWRAIRDQGYVFGRSRRAATASAIASRSSDMPAQFRFESWGGAAFCPPLPVYSLLIMLAMYPAPKPLSMLTTATPAEQLLSMARSADRP